MEGFVVVDEGIEHLGIGLEGDGSTGAVGGADNGHLLGDVTPGEAHLVDLATLVYPHLQPLREGVDHRGAHAVEAAGDLVAAAAELAAGVEDGIDHLQGGLAGLRLDVHGDAAAIVGDGDGIALVDDDVDLIAVAGQGLVDGVVHDLVDQVMKAGSAGGADVHTGALAHGLETLQDLDLAGVVGFFYFGKDIFRHSNLHLRWIDG